MTNLRYAGGQYFEMASHLSHFWQEIQPFSPVIRQVGLSNPQGAPFHLLHHRFHY